MQDLVAVVELQIVHSRLVRHDASDTRGLEHNALFDWESVDWMRVVGRCIGCADRCRRPKLQSLCTNRGFEVWILADHYDETRSSGRLLWWKVVGIRNRC